MVSILVPLCILFFSATSLLSAENNENRNDILYTNLAGIAIITGWGIANWDYGNSSPYAKNEGWFGAQTKYGGADKLGHFYTTHILSSGLSHLYENWGYNRGDAALYGSLSSFSIMNAMEIGDAFSAQQGFSYEDFIFNTLGSITSYLLYTQPQLSKRIDLRVEYIPSFKTADIVTEYDNMKYLIALKADGFESITNPLLKYGELHLGYYTRNYTAQLVHERERVLYIGIGINLSKITRQNGYNKTAALLNYYQLPYTYLPYEQTSSNHF